MAEAVLIAAFISLVLDGPAKTEIADAAARRAGGEWRKLSESGLWAILNPEAWDEHKSMVIDLARKKTFLGRVEWRIHFQSDPQSSELLRLIVDVEAHGQTFDDAGTFPSGKAPLLASSDGRESRYTSFVLHRVRNRKRVQIISIGEPQLKSPDLGLMTGRADGAAMLDLDRLRINHASAEFQEGDEFIEKKTAEVFRHTRGFFPMWTRATTCDTTVTVTNEAAVDLTFTLARLDELQVYQLETGREQNIGGLPPGCAFVLSWAEKDNGI